MWFIKCLLACIASLQALPTVANQENDSSSLLAFEAKYIAIRSGKDIGTARLSLNIDNQAKENTNLAAQPAQNLLYSLQYQSKVKRFFLSDRRYETTQFSVQNGEFVPHEYKYRRTGTGPDKSLKVSFNAKDNKIIVDDKPAYDWSGEFDNQLFRIDLPRQLARGLTKTHYDFINYRGEQRRYDFVVMGEENLELPYGQLNAIKVQINRQSNSRVSYAWFAPSLSHNLVRLQQFKDNKEQGDMQLSEFTYQN